MSNQHLPEYEKPPVIEVVCGVHFQQLEGLLAPYLGSLWEKLKPDYPECKEVAPLAPVIERFDAPAKSQMTFVELPPMARTWFVHKNETGIVQVQRDRFLHNWKKVREQDEYPRFAKVITLFKERLATFEDFLNEQSLGGLQPLQYELTYVNHIPRGEAWSTLADTGNVFPDFKRRNRDSRYLPEPETINWRTSFLFPEKVGRLHAVIRNAIRTEDQTPIIQLELTARGMPHSGTRDAMWSWFDLAHTWIVTSFTDLASETVRKNVWRQIQ